MSGIEGQFPPGLGVTDEDLQRVADVAAAGEDRALSLLAFPGGADGATRIKRVIPLHDELRTPMTVGSNPNPLWNNPRVLCSAAVYHGGAAGIVRTLPCAFEVVPVSTVPAAQLAPFVARLDAFADVGPFGTTAGGRVDTIYATVTWEVPVLGQRDRRVKDPTTGVVATASTTVYRQPVVTIHIAVGTEASFTPGAVPADGSESYNVKLAEVWLPAGYTSGGNLYDGSGGFLRQKWERGAVRPSAVALVRSGQGQDYTGGADGGIGVELGNSTRGCEYQIVRSIFRHTAVTARITLDRGIDWRNRLVRVSILRSAAQSVLSPYGLYPPPGGVASGGPAIAVGGEGDVVNTGWIFTGAVSDPDLAVGEFYSSGGTPKTFKLYANSSTSLGAPWLGALVLTIAEAPDDGANGGDHYVAIIETFASDYEVR